MAKRSSAPARLTTYAAKRDFSHTPEPPARPKRSAAKGKLSFCVQKHLASTLHYDFRLEHEGVLLSWAVPKGPSLNPADKRMAMRTEDHPLAYGDFEGVIPTGYGAGIVVLWDRGTWEPEVEDIAAAMAKGDLKFRLHGKKLNGSFVLVRMKRPEQREPWLLIKHRDAYVSDIDITAEHPQSVKSVNDFAGVLAHSKDSMEFLKHSHVRGGQAGAALKEAIAGATEILTRQNAQDDKSRAARARGSGGANKKKAAGKARRTRS